MLEYQEAERNGKDGKIRQTQIFGLKGEKKKRKCMPTMNGVVYILGHKKREPKYLKSKV